jgi:Fe-S-cluster containining protein
MLIAKAHLDREGEIKKIEILKKIKFRCIRCAKFCCSLGAPNLTEEDKKIHSNSKAIVERKYKGAYKGIGDCSFESNGYACCFLQYNKNKAKCAIYPRRPTLCRLYPFSLAKEKDCIKISLLPCLGLNHREGRPIDKAYIEKLISKYRNLL